MELNAMFFVGGALLSGVVVWFSLKPKRDAKGRFTKGA